MQVTSFHKKKKKTNESIFFITDNSWINNRKLKVYGIILQLT